MDTVLSGLTALVLWVLLALALQHPMPAAPPTDASEATDDVVEHGPPGVECHQDPFDFQHRYCAYDI